MDPLPHLDSTGKARMVDIAAKAVTQRTATATGLLRTSSEVIELLRGEGVPKGDALAVARIAAIAGTKRTADLIPLCHLIQLDGVDVGLDVINDGVAITVTCRATDRTGVEMEALTGVAVAGLALHDMVKAVDPAAVLTDVKLIAKTGGRPGTGPGSEGVRPDGVRSSQQGRTRRHQWRAWCPTAVGGRLHGDDGCRLRRRRHDP